MVIKVGIKMRIGETVIESGMNTPPRRKEKGIRIGMFLPTSVKHPKTLKVVVLRICCHIL